MVWSIGARASHRSSARARRGESRAFAGGARERSVGGVERVHANCSSGARTLARATSSSACAEEQLPLMASSLLARRLLDASRARVARDGVRIVSRAASSASAPCWSCGEPSTSATAETLEGDFFCASCGVIQPPSGADHFKTLGVCVRTMR